MCDTWNTGIIIMLLHGCVEVECGGRMREDRKKGGGRLGGGKIREWKRAIAAIR